MDINEVRTLLAVLVMLAFAGIVVWAYGGKRQPRFEAAARSVLHDEPPSGREPGDESNPPAGEDRP